MGKGITQPGNEPAEQPSAADALAAENEQAKAKTTAGTAEALAASDGPLADVEAGLNQDVKGDTTAEGTEPAEPEKEEEKVEPIIALATVQPLMTKKPSELSDPEAELLGKYYTQEAKLCNEKGETFKALMMHLRALLTSLKLDFLNPPKDEAKTTTDAPPTGEAPLATPSPTEKPTTLETVASEVEQAKGVPGIVLLALAKVENKETTKDNLTLIADDVLAKLAKEKPDKNDPVKYLTAYLEKKLGLKKEDPASQKRLAEEIAKYHLAINAMHGKKEISYTGYYAWASRIQKDTAPKATLQPDTTKIENIQPGSLLNMLTPQWKKRMKGERIANINMIEKMVTAAGYSIRMAAAMIANAWSESGITNNAAGDHGKSIGIFQLHKNGRGKGMSVEQRKIPQENIGKMLRNMAKEKIIYKGRKTNFMEADRSGASVEELTQLFCYHMERPDNKAQKAIERAQQARNMFS